MRTKIWDVAKAAFFSGEEFGAPSGRYGDEMLRAEEEGTGVDAY